VTPHALRHTAASLAIAAGANVKVVQTMLGHKSATMTLDLYGHLFGDQLDQVADAMDAARTAFQDHADLCGLSRLLVILRRSARGLEASKYGGFSGAPPGTRTPNPLIKSQLLCQLS
jgi:hypothetical protein